MTSMLIINMNFILAMLLIIPVTALAWMAMYHYSWYIKMQIRDYKWKIEKNKYL